MLGGRTTGEVFGRRHEDRRKGAAGGLNLPLPRLRLPGILRRSRRELAGVEPCLVPRPFNEAMIRQLRRQGIIAAIRPSLARPTDFLFDL